MTTARPARWAAIARRSPARRARSLVVTGGHPSSDFHRFADVIAVNRLQVPGNVLNEVANAGRVSIVKPPSVSAIYNS